MGTLSLQNRIESKYLLFRSDSFVSLFNPCCMVPHDELTLYIVSVAQSPPQTLLLQRIISNRLCGLFYFIYFHVFTADASIFEETLCVCSF